MCIPGKFDVVKVATVLQQSLHDDDDVLLSEYIDAYEEIDKFFLLLGSVFGFVSRDIRNKIDILTKLNENNDCFRSVKGMMMHETSTNLLSDTKYVSGSRTLLRLHRGLEFFFEFLMRVSKLEANEKLYSCCKTAYNDTLAKYHPFLIRKSAIIAMYTLPTQSELVMLVCPTMAEAVELLSNMLQSIDNVYKRIDQLYTHYGLHNLQ